MVETHENAMPHQPEQTIRELLLTEIHSRRPHSPTDAALDQGSVLRAVGMKVGKGNDEAILTQMGELFRTGLLAWGFNLANPDPPMFHLTDRGKQALERLTRDPSNPAGYLRHVSSITNLDPVAEAYLKEGLDCYVAGLFKASAVMVGGSAESVILRLRGQTVQKLRVLGRMPPKSMEGWQIKAVSDALYKFFEAAKERFDRKLQDSFTSYWPAFASQIRAVRNDAGHPLSIDPVTPDAVHAALLVFPELVRLARDLEEWVRADLR